MPREIKAFGCEFACGRIATHRKRMVEHEARCFKNPACRACQTCSNYNPPYDGDESDGYAFEAAYCDVRDDVDFTKSLEHHCDKWSNAKLTDPNERR